MNREQDWLLLLKQLTERTPPPVAIDRLDAYIEAFRLELQFATPSWLGHRMLRSVLQAVDDGEFKCTADGEASIPYPETVGEKVVMELWSFHREVAEVFEGLRIIVETMASLVELADVLDKPRQRYSLLRRAYFAEYARVKDMFGRFLKTLQDLKLIDRETRRGVAHSLYDTLEPFLRVRNEVLHGSDHRTGTVWYQLALYEAAPDKGLALKSHDETVVTISAGLRAILAEDLPSLRIASVTLHSSLSGIARYFHEMLQQHVPDPNAWEQLELALGDSDVRTGHNLSQE